MSYDYSVECRIIRFGDMGFDVKMIQRLLFCSGIKDKNTGKGCRITGILDNQTIRILNKFQKRKGLPIKPYVNQDTFQALMRW